MLEIKAIVNVKLECDACGFDEVSMGVEVDTIAGWNDFEEQAMFGLQGWQLTENASGLITYECPSCADAQPKPQHVTTIAESSLALREG